MAQFKVLAPLVCITDKDGKPVQLKVNEVHNIADFNSNDLLPLFLNSKPLVMAAIEKKLGKSNISLTDENTLKIIKDSTGEFKSSIELVDGDLPAVKKVDEVAKVKETIANLRK